MVLISGALDFKEAFSKKVLRNIAGTPIHLASIEDMITLKKAAGREQDLSDIAHLERFLNE